jgi:hypothetical protein
VSRISNQTEKEIKPVFPCSSSCCFFFNIFSSSVLHTNRTYCACRNFFLIYISNRAIRYRFKSHLTIMLNSLNCLSPDNLASYIYLLKIIKSFVFSHLIVSHFIRKSVSLCYIVSISLCLQAVFEFYSVLMQNA